MFRSLPLLALGLATQVARAQDVVNEDEDVWFDAHNLFVAAYDGDLRDPLRLNRPGRLTQWDWFLGGVLEYANAPLVHYQVVPAEGGGEETKGTSLLTHVVALNLSGGVTFHKYFRLDVAAPVYFASFDANDDYQGVDFGDMRFTAMVPLLHGENFDKYDEGVGLGVFGRLDVPSGRKVDFLGNDSVAGGGGLSFSYAAPFGLTVTAEAGVHFRDSVDLANIDGSDRFVGGLAVGYLVHETTAINLEADLEAAFPNGEDDQGDEVPSLTESPMEMTLTVRHRRPSGANLLVGAAAGMTRGAGAARARVFLGAGYGHISPPPPKDCDADGILDAFDSCVCEPETVNGYQDDDGCPDELASLGVRVLKDGEPVEGAEILLSRQGDEQVERMVSATTPRVREGLEPGVTWEGTGRLGPCLAGDAAVQLQGGMNSLDIPLHPDRSARVVYELTGVDGKPVTDAVATWRTESEGCAEREGYVVGPTGRYEHPIGPGSHTVFIDAPGYRIYREDVTLKPGDTYVIRTQLKPTKVQVGKKEITILEKVYFEFNSATIKPESFDLLNEVADTIQANDVGRVLVEGHTDSKGSDAYNLDLSDRRANSVREYLIGRGVPADQLLAKGFGESRPVATNATESGRAKNRRVVFTLIDRDQQYIEVEEGQ